MADAIPPTSPTPVSARPPDLLGGTTRVCNAGDSLAGKIGQCVPGDTLLIEPNLDFGPITLPPRSDPGWIRLMSAGPLPPRGRRVTPADAPQLFTLVSTGEINTARALIANPDTQGWHIVGMRGTHPSATQAYGVFDIFGRRIILERVYGHANPSQSCASILHLQGGEHQVWDSALLEGHSDGSTGDGQAVWISSGDTMHIENTQLEGAGENIMLGDQYQALPCVDITIRRNTITKPDRWRNPHLHGSPNPSWDGITWVVKQLFEIKWARRVLFEGNIVDHNWAGQGQDSTPVMARSGQGVMSMDTQDVMYRSNLLLRSPYGFAVDTFGDTGPRIKRIAILNNLVFAGGRLLTMSNHCDDLWCEHNTGVPFTSGYEATGGAAALWHNGAIAGSLRYTLKRNVVGVNLYGFSVEVAPGTTTEAVVAPIWPDRSFAENAIYNNGSVADAPNGFRQFSSSTAAGIDPTTGRLTATSPLKFGQPGYFGTDGTDIGVDFPALAAALSGTGGGVARPNAPILTLLSARWES